MRRLVYMNFDRLFKITCNAPGHSEVMISVLPEECPFPVYDYQYFIGDDFDPFSFGVEYQRNDSPMTTLFSLRKKFPMPSFLNRDPSSINSEYTNGGRNLKNGYYAFGCYSSEDVWYTTMLNRSRAVMNSRAIQDSDQVYGSLCSDHIYKSAFVYFSANCTDSMFLFDCRNCTNCFGGVNLRNAKYRIFNEQVSKVEYEKFISSIQPISRDQLNKYEKQFWELVKKLPMNASRNTAAEESTGVLLNHSRNVFDVNEADNSEHIRHADGALSHKDSMDFLFSGGHSSLLYGTVNIGSQSSGVRFSVSSKFCTDSEFIFNSKNLSNCFMCFGLQNKSYCVLNRQYEPKEYFSLIDEIKTEMLEHGEYANGPGMEFSAQAYNFSLAQISYPLSNEEILKLEGYVAKEPDTNVGDLRILDPEAVPPTIDETTDEILDDAIRCAVTGRPFRIIESELAFYRKIKLPLPVTHPALRMEGNQRLAPPGKRYSAFCAKCQKPIDSLFDPNKGFKLYCENCFQREVT
jgi:hypothetical protein